MSSYVTKKTHGNTEWFTHDRFGMFIHFGLYSMAARHEWVKWVERTPEEKYDLYFNNFNPDLFDAREWARAAKRAGMKYAVLTTKHHEGFCLFDSQYTDYKSTNTPFGRDIVREYVDAFRAEGLKIGLYYSVADWHHPEFPIDWFHPRRDDADAEEKNRPRDIHKYAKYMRDQVTELLTNYGKIDILWFDLANVEPWDGLYLGERIIRKPWMGSHGAEEFEAKELLDKIRSLQPDIIINNRLFFDQDVWTPEQVQPTEWVRHPETNELVNWEACQTISGSWGYHRDEMSVNDPETSIEMLINTVCCGGNLIMNVGPTPRGYIDYRAEKMLGIYENWMKYCSRSIYDCTMAEPEFTEPRGCRLTQSRDGKRLYIHLVEYPFERLVLKDAAGRVEYAQFLHDGSEILFHEENGNVRFEIPRVRPKLNVSVIELFLK